MKKSIFRVIATMCALFVAISCLNFGGAEEKDNSGRLAAVYAYTLNDYIFTYGLSVALPRALLAIPGHLRTLRALCTARL